MSRGDTRRALATIGAGLRQLLAVRWVRATVILLLLALGVRAGLERLLAFTLDRVAAERELTCGWDGLDLSLFSARAELRLLEIASLPTEEDGEPEPLLEIEYGVFDLDVLALLRGKLRVSRAEVDGLDSWWTRDAAGAWNVARHVDAAELIALLESEATAEEERADGEPEPLDLSLPIAVDALRFQHARLHLLDHAVEPPVALVFELNAGLSHLNDRTRPTRFTVTATGGDALAGANLEGEVAWSSDALHLSTRAHAGGLRPKALAPYLAALGLRPACETIDGRLRADVRLKVVGEARDAIGVQAALDGVRLDVDGRESLALDRIGIEVASLSADGARVAGVEVEGLRGKSSLEAGGTLRLAGLDLVGSRASRAAGGPAGGPAGPGFLEAMTDLVTAELPPWAALLTRTDADAYAWSLGSLRMSGGEIRLTDRTVVPEASFPLLIDRAELGEVVHDPRVEARAIPVVARMRAPGMARSIQLDGELQPFAPERHVELTLAVDGIGLEALAGHLERAGLERAIEEGSFRLRLAGEARTDADGRTEGRLALDEIALRDGGDLFGARSVVANGLVFDPRVPLLRLGELEIAGPHLALGRDPTRGFFAFGLRTLGFGAHGSVESQGAPDAPAPAPAPAEADEVAGAPARETRQPTTPLRIELGRVAWTDSDIEFVDGLADPPRRLQLEHLGFELTDLTLGGDPAGPVPEPARFSVRLSAEELLDELTVEGLVHSRPGRIDLTAELALRGHGVSGRLAAPYTRPLGFEPVLESGTASLEIVASLKEDPAGWQAGLRLRDASLEDGGTTLLSLDELRVDDVLLGERIEVGEVALVAPFARVEREAAGTLRAAGVRATGGGPPSPSEPPRVKVSAPPTLAFPRLPAVRVSNATVENARLVWLDAAATPAIETELRLDAAARGLATDGSAGAFEARLSIPDTIDALETSGEVTLGPEEARLAGDLAVRGVRPGPLARLLPAGIELESANGVLGVAFEAQLAPAEGGGLAARLAARDLDWREAGEAPWLSCARAELAVPRLDPASGIVEIGPVAVDGATLALERDAAGVLHGLGMRVGGGEPRRELPAQDETPAPPATPREIALPGIALVDDVALRLERFTFRDASLGPDARPLEGAVSFVLDGPCTIVDGSAPDLAPLAWNLEGAVSGLVEHWTVEGRIAPFAAEPRLEARFDASGVRTAGLIELVPALAGRVSGDVEDGTVGAELEATLSVRRARPTELGLSRPFGAAVQLDGLAFRDAPDGVVLAGIDRIAADVERVDASRGRIHVRTLELTRPRGLLRRSASGLHAMGLVVALQPAPPEPAPAVEEPRAVPVEAAAGTDGDEAAVAPDGGTGELRIDEIVVSGIDFEMRDDTVEPPLRVPLTELDVEVARFTTRALVEPRPLRFSAYVGSNPGGVPVFEEASASGRIVLHPAPAGWAQLSLEGLELPPFSSLAEAQGIAVEDGALDASARLRLLGESGVSVDSTLVFTDLDVAEEKGGPIESLLALPMTLDTAIFLLRNADGELRVSTGFTVDRAGISGAQIASAAAQAAAGVLARALAGAPLRALAGLVPGSKEKKPRRSWTLDFAPGATEVPARFDVVLAEAARALEAGRSLELRLRHELTEEDVARAEGLANPPPEACLEMIAGLRQRKAELLRRRDEVETEAHALYAVGDVRAAGAPDVLRGLEREIASVESTLDGVFEILDSDSARKRAKRTRAASRRIAELRLETVEELLRSDLVGSARSRIEVRAPRLDTVPGPGGGRVVLTLRDR